MQLEVINGNIPSLTYKSNTLESMFYDKVLLWKFSFGIGAINSLEENRVIGKTHFINVELISGQKFEAKVSEKDLIRITTIMKSNSKINSTPFKTSFSRTRCLFLGGVAIIYSYQYWPDSLKSSFEHSFNNNANTAIIEELSEKTYTNICIQAIDNTFGREPSIIKTDKPYTTSSPTVKVHYIRKDDKTRWANECKFEGNRILWRVLPGTNIDKIGRWRDNPEGDGIMKFSVNGNNITIENTYPDGQKEQPVTFKINEYIHK